MKRVTIWKIIEWVLKLSFAVVLFVGGYKGNNHDLNSWLIFTSGAFLAVLMAEIDEYLKERRAAKENELINQIGED